jgi:hypothetical protein
MDGMLGSGQVPVADMGVLLVSLPEHGQNLSLEPELAVDPSLEDDIIEEPLAKRPRMDVNPDPNQDPSLEDEAILTLAAHNTNEPDGQYSSEWV